MEKRRYLYTMNDMRITLVWNPLGKFETIGHQLPNGWWYVFTPFDNEWHHVMASDVSNIRPMDKK